VSIAVRLTAAEATESALLYSHSAQLMLAPLRVVEVDGQHVTGPHAARETQVVLESMRGLTVHFKNHLIPFDVGLEGWIHRIHGSHDSTPHMVGKTVLQGESLIHLPVERPFEEVMALGGWKRGVPQRPSVSPRRSLDLDDGRVQTVCHIGKRGRARADRFDGSGSGGREQVFRLDRVELRRHTRLDRGRRGGPRHGEAHERDDETIRHRQIIGG